MVGGELPCQRRGPAISIVAPADDSPVLEHETVDLSLRQRISALLLDGILRGQNQERRIQLEGLVADGYLLFLHRLQQRALHLGWRPVHLVGQDEVGEYRPFLDAEIAGAGIVYPRAYQICRQQVGGELDAGEPGPESLGRWS